MPRKSFPQRLLLGGSLACTAALAFAVSCTDSGSLPASTIPDSDGSDWDGSDGEDDSDVDAEAPPIDATTDAIVPEAGPPPGFCASRPYTSSLCTDFDTSTSATGWDYQFAQPGSQAKLSIDSTTARSAPNSFLVSFASPDAGTTSTTQAYLLHSFNVLPYRARTSFDFRLDGYDPTHSYSIATFMFGSFNSGRQLQLLLYIDWQSKGFVVSEKIREGSTDISFKQHPLPATLVQGRWTPIVFDVQYGSPASFTLSYDGNVLISKKPISIPTPVSTYFGQQLGLPYAEGTFSPEMTLRFDNAVLDLQ